MDTKQLSEKKESEVVGSFREFFPLTFNRVSTTRCKQHALILFETYQIVSTSIEYGVGRYIRYEQNMGVVSVRVASDTPGGHHGQHRDRRLTSEPAQ